MNFLSSGSSIRSYGTHGTHGTHGTNNANESREDRFTRKLKDLQQAEHEISKCKDNLKQWQSRKTTLEDWVKTRMINKATEDNVPKVQVVYNNNMYTVDRTKKYKNKAPTQKQIKSKLVNYFNETELSDFMAKPTSEKAESIYNYLYGNVGYHQKVAFSKRTLIKTPKKK